MIKIFKKRKERRKEYEEYMGEVFANLWGILSSDEDINLIVNALAGAIDSISETKE
jgi:hypothetical protein